MIGVNSTSLYMINAAENDQHLSSYKASYTLHGIALGQAIGTFISTFIMADNGDFKPLAEEEIPAECQALEDDAEELLEEEAEDTQVDDEDDDLA